jgi:uncharacterized damage-inducible protein DinB
MKLQSIGDIYEANAAVRKRLTGVLATVTPTEATAKADGESWNIQQIVEHLTMVEFGTARICTKLLGEAKNGGKPSSGRVELSAIFAERRAEIAKMRVEAPDRVYPTGNVPILESFERMEANKKVLDEMRPELERYDITDHKFPHPYFGEITAAEWLVILGGHEMRHTKQIETLLEKLRQ